MFLLIYVKGQDHLIIWSKRNARIFMNRRSFSLSILLGSISTFQFWSTFCKANAALQSNLKIAAALSSVPGQVPGGLWISSAPCLGSYCISKKLDCRKSASGLDPRYGRRENRTCEGMATFMVALEFSCVLSPCPVNSFSDSLILCTLSLCILTIINKFGGIYLMPPASVKKKKCIAGLLQNLSTVQFWRGLCPWSLVTCQCKVAGMDEQVLWLCYIWLSVGQRCDDQFSVDCFDLSLTVHLEI